MGSKSSPEVVGRRCRKSKAADHENQKEREAAGVSAGLMMLEMVA